MKPTIVRKNEMNFETRSKFMIYILSGWQRAFAPSVKRIAAHNCGTMASDEKNQKSTITND